MLCQNQARKVIFMDMIICLLVGYFFGSLSPAALLGSKNGVDLRQAGTKNLGASNTLLVLGKKQGFVVMLFDILKAYLPYNAMQFLFPKLHVAGLLTGSAAVAGHIFPFYLGFRGGKGLASFAGLVLAYNPKIFLFLLLFSGTLLILVNYSFIMPFSASVLFPLLAGAHSKDLYVTLICLCVSGLVLCKHWSNLGRAMRGEEIKIRSYIRESLFVKKHS